jgi:hypothetical protein
MMWGLWAYTVLMSFPVNPAELLAGAVLAGAVVAVSGLVAARLAGWMRPASGAARMATAVRQRIRGARLPRLYDPDAKGRPRPRAPGLALPAA